MDWLNFLRGIHRRLHVDIPEADYASLRTLADVVGYVETNASKPVVETSNERTESCGLTFRSASNARAMQRGAAHQDHLKTRASRKRPAQRLNNFGLCKSGLSPRAIARRSPIASSL